MVSASRLMSVGPCYGGTAQLGVVGRMCGGPAASGAGVDVEVVLACVPQVDGAGGLGMGTALTHSEEVILQEHWYPQGMSCVTIAPNGKKKRNVGRWIGVKIGGGRCSMTMSPGTRGTVGAAPSPPYCAAGLFGDQACISAGSSSTQHHFSCGRSARISVTERRCRGEGEQGCTHSIHPTCPTLPCRCATAAPLPSADGV